MDGALNEIAFINMTYWGYSKVGMQVAMNDYHANCILVYINDKLHKYLQIKSKSFLFNLTKEGVNSSQIVSNANQANLFFC